MFIIRRGWTKSSLCVRTGSRVVAPHFFSTDLGLSKLKQIHSALLTDHRKLKPQKTIKMLSYLNSKSQEKGEQSILQPAEVYSIVKGLSSQMGSLNHEDITLLLQTMSDFPAYSRYNRNNESMKALMKKLSVVQTIRLDSRYMFRLLHVLEKVRFPPMIIGKYINNVLSGESKSGMDNLDTLRFFSCILNMKFVHVSLVAKLYQKQLKNINLTTPIEFTYMYYIMRTLDKSLQDKLTYMSDKLQVQSLVFHSPAEANQKGEPNQKTGQNALQNERQKMIQASENLMIQMKKQIDMEKLKSTLCRFYEFEKNPLNTTSAVILHDVQELRGTLFEYLKGSLKKMQPFEFITVLPSAPESERIDYYESYVKAVWKHLPVKQKLSMLYCKQQLCKAEVSKQAVLGIIRQSKSISTSELQMIAQMMQNYLREDEQLEVIKAIEGLMGDIDEQ